MNVNITISLRKTLIIAGGLLLISLSTFVSSAQGVKLTAGTTFKMSGTTTNLVLDDGGIAGQGNIEVAAGATFDAAGLVSLDGDFIMNGLFIENMSDLVLTGTLDQALSGTFSFYDVTISKLGGTAILGNNYSISNQLDLISGLVVSDLSSLFTIEETAEIINGSVTAYIDGPLQITTQSSAGTQELYFPIGNSSDGTNPFRPARIIVEQTDAIATVYQAEFITTPSIVAVPVSIMVPPNAGYWKIEGLSGTNVNSPQLYLDIVPADFNLGEKVLVLGNNAGTWENLGGQEFVAGLDSVFSTVDFGDFVTYTEFTVGSIVLPTVRPESVSANTSTCEGQEVFLEPEFTGATGPFDIYYHYDAVNGSGLAMSNGDLFSLGTALLPGTYTVLLDSLFDATGCRVTTASGSVSMDPWMVVVNPLPTATLTAPLAICDGEDVNLTFTFPIAATGSTNFNVIVDDGAGTTTTLTDVVSGAVQTVVSPGVGTYSYTIVSVEDIASTCLQTDVMVFTNTGDVEVMTLPDGTMTGDATICPGDMATILFDLPDTGGPFDIELSDGSIFTSIPDGGTVQVAPLADITYTIDSISYSNLPACKVSPNTSSSVSVQVTQLSATVTDSPAQAGACEGEPIPGLNIGLAGSGPFDIFYHNDIDMTVESVSGFNNGDQLMLGTLPGGMYVVTLDSVQGTSGCTATAAQGLVTGSWDIAVSSKPTAILSSTINTICQGELMDVSFTFPIGIGPFDIILDDGLGGTETLIGVTSGVSQTFTPVSAGSYIYTILSVDDLGCVETDISKFTGLLALDVVAAPDGTLAGTAVICSGETTSLTFTLPVSGGPYDVTLSDGSLLSAINNAHVENISPTSDINLTIESISYSGQVPNCQTTPATFSEASITVNPLPTAIFTDASLTSCPDNDFSLNFSLSGNGPFEIVYNNGISDVNVNGIANTSHTEILTATSNTTFTLVSVSDNNNCLVNITGETVSLTLTAPPTSTLTSSDPDLQICVDEPITFTTSGATNYEFYLNDVQVLGPGGISSYSISANTLEPGDYTVRLVAVDANSCIAEDQLDFSVFAIPEDAFERELIRQMCLGDDPYEIDIRAALQGGTLTGSPGLVEIIAGVSYLFDPVLAGVGSHVITYTVSINGCTGTISATIVVNEGPQVEFSIVSERLFIGSPIVFSNQSNGANGFLWNFGDSGESVENNPTHTYGSPGDFNVTLDASNSSTGCSDQFVLPITIEEFPVKVMNIITPNGDGQNDILFIQDIGFYNSEVLVLDRWGNKVVTLINYNNDPLSWDASSVSAGNYTVLVNISDSSNPTLNVEAIKQVVTVIK